jgi:hypothetical protein
VHLLPYDDGPPPTKEDWYVAALATLGSFLVMLVVMIWLR